eukprot:81461_1
MTESTSRRPAYARLLDRAVRILAVRDHSEQELRRKLAAPIMGKNGPEEIDATAEDYERVIAWCHEHGYLDDSRFVARFIATRGICQAAACGVILLSSPLADAVTSSTGTLALASRIPRRPDVPAPR